MEVATEFSSVLVLLKNTLQVVSFLQQLDYALIECAVGILPVLCEGFGWPLLQITVVKIFDASLEKNIQFIYLFFLFLFF